MINFRKIYNINDLNHDVLLHLYINSFPENERRSIDSLETLLASSKQFNMFALTNENGFVGFINYWNFDQFYYIEHFAILPQLRNSKYGSEAIKAFMLQTKKPIVLEVEMPRSTLAAHRIHFYERLGFYVLSNAYQQPPYDGVSFMIPMLIMSNDYHYANKHFQLIKNMLYKEVYAYAKEEDE